MGKSGILLIAAGKGSYAGWAANMAASLRYWNPDIQIALAVHGQAGQLATEPLYDHIIPIPDKWCHNFEGKFAPGKMKLHMDLLSPFERTIYLDVDGLCLKPIGYIFEKLKGRKVAGQVLTESETDSDKWGCQWMTLANVRHTYPIRDGKIQELNSSFFYFEKESAEYFETARRCYIDNYKTQWGSSFPDELALNVAGNICGIDMKIDFAPVSFYGKEKDAHFVGLYGGIDSTRLKAIKIYEQEIRKVYPKVMRMFSPHKVHIMMKHKFINNGMSMMGMKQERPSPVSAKPKLVCAVTAAPRKRETLPDTLESIKQYNPIVFAEPETPTVKGYKFEINETRLGCFKNYYHTIERLLNDYHADYYLICEDDIKPLEGFDETISEVIKYNGRGAFALFQHTSPYHKHGGKGFAAIKIGRKYAGMLAMLYDKATLEKIFNHQKFKDHYLNYPYNQQRDMIVGEILQSINVHNPSLVEHTGYGISTLNKEHIPSFKGTDY